MSGGHGAVDSSNKKVALLISVLALFLALGETLAKSAQTEALSANVESSNLWAYFQARTIRTTILKTAGEQIALDPGASPEAVKKQVEDWAKTMARWDSDPSSGDGRKELAAKAKKAEEKRDLALERYHHYEIGSAAFQIGIVLASAQVITGIAALAFAGGALGVAGIAMLAIGLFAPHAIHLV
ncbi:DUF4337 domain-containing protein [Methylobacterium aquaticum]|uniref:DUF4337 domain-containing protein n=1 Tax=Methylobacterium aquaticum TaxID=270351 RepID=A0A0J6SM44_9HYPH|nr:DUF4337 domain-containing protein [Methylobacterium aquaticum]KMO34473.1 hypothetical protein VP06_14065 [Methylobacterium aquaticum]